MPPPHHAIHGPANGRGSTVEDWTLDRHMVAMNLLAFPLFLAALILYVLPILAARLLSGMQSGVKVEIPLNGSGLGLWLVVLVAAVIILFVLHEAIHGLAFRLFGASPSFGFKLVKSMPVLYCTGPGTRLTGRQFGAVVMAPTAVIGLSGLLLVLLPQIGGMLVLPLALHLSGCTGDWWILAATARRPAGTLVEDLPDGVRYHLPTTLSSTSMG